MICRLLLLLELLLLCLAAAPLGTHISEAKNLSSPLTCTNVPYPFGKAHEAMPGFEITCGGINGTAPILRLNNTGFPIEDISLPRGQLSIRTGVFFHRCYNKTLQNLGAPYLEGTPYTISTTENMLKLVGCNHMVIMQGLSGNLTSGCVTFCYSADSVVDGSCSGLGCCQGSVPKGLKSFSPLIFRLDRLNENQIFNSSVFNISNWNAICSDLFVVKESSFSFSSEKLWSGGYSSRSSQNTYTTVLEWAIGNETCKEAERKMATYACKENSYCYDSTNGVGYLCNCTQGYEGNPYIKGGCTDINECEHPELNPCVGRCINKPGSVSCACPFGQHGDGKKNGTGCSKTVPLGLALGVGLSLLFTVFTGSLMSYWILKKRKLIKMKARFFQQNGGLFLQQQIISEGSNGALKIFNIEELEKATNNFNESQILGRGGYGTVYKGVLPSQRVIAIKKSKLVDESQTEQFINEIIILCQINHRNVVKLLGCCLETQVPLLVYEFISNGTLFQHIHGQSHDLSMPWEDRIRIAAEAAGALAYLHSAASVPIIHRDVKSTNILLDDNYTAKVSDFGASRSVPFDQEHITTVVQGTFGYLDPEYFHTSKLTEKSDVYSFGVVLVELLTREIPVSFARSEDHRNLATYFTLMFDKQHLLQLVEPRIVEEAGMDQFFEAAQLARRCLDLKGEERPTMKEVAMELERIRRFHKQRLAPQNLDKMKHLVGGIGPSKESLHSDTSASMDLQNLDEMGHLLGEIAPSNEYLHSDMLASMDLPR